MHVGILPAVTEVALIVIEYDETAVEERIRPCAGLPSCS